MRIIKFRAWDKVNKNMLYDVSTGTVTIWYKEISSKSENCVFMQYTNLKDKNDKEIYENDVVANEYGYKFEIVFKDGCWFAGDTEVGFMRKDKYKIIGNIYENPELLERIK